MSRGKQTKTLEIKSWVLTEKMFDYEVFEKGLRQSSKVVDYNIHNQ